MINKTRQMLFRFFEMYDMCLGNVIFNIVTSASMWVVMRMDLAVAWGTL